MQRYAIGIDSGGTFTDFFVVDSDGHYHSHKTPSTPGAPAMGVMNGLRELAERYEQPFDNFLAQVDLIVHGTTVTTNAVLTGKGADTWLLTTEGLRDILEMRRGIRGTFYDNKYVAPPPPVPRDQRLTVSERIAADGTVIKPLPIAEVETIAKRLKQAGAESVAICFAHSYLKSEHERRAAEIIARELPGAYLSVSSELLPQVRLYNRVSTTALNAYAGPVLQRYLRDLVERLKESGYQGTLLIMQSNGGIATPDTITRSAVSSLLSGPAAGPAAALAYSAPHGHKNCIVVDMGGTSFDCGLIRDGQPFTTRESELNRNLIAVPALAIHTVGAGGGSIAWIDEGGLLRMGPQSAGASPGPACYNNGGQEPTCTDANVVLGYLNPDFFLGGRMTLDKERAAQAITAKIAEPQGLSTVEAAWGMYRVITAKMADAMREISVEKGYDPREFVMVAGGGAGALHAAMIARELDMPIVLIPRESSIMCAAGMLMADLRYDYVHTFYRSWNKVEPTDIQEVLSQLEAKGRVDLSRTDLGDDEISFIYSADVRYTSQHDELTVEFPADSWLKDGTRVVAENFHAAHDRLYGYSLKEAGTPLELVCLRVTAVGKRQRVDLRGSRNPNAALREPKGERQIYLPETASMMTVPVYDADRLAADFEFEGPAVLERSDTTILVPAGTRFSCDVVGNVILKLGARLQPVSAGAEVNAADGRREK